MMLERRPKGFSEDAPGYLSTVPERGGSARALMSDTAPVSQEWRRAVPRALDSPKGHQGGSSRQWRKRGGWVPWVF